jgi:hypothetical protein
MDSEKLLDLACEVHLALRVSVDGHPDNREKPDREPAHWLTSLSIGLYSEVLNAYTPVRIRVIQLRSSAGNVAELFGFQRHLQRILESLSSGERLNVARDLHIDEQLRIQVGSHVSDLLGL